MVLVTGNWRVALAGLLASLIIFAVVFFAVVKPSENTANQAVKAGLQQTQQALNRAQKQTSSAAGAANQTVNRAAKLTACLANAGVDTTKLQTCQAQYGS
jgi:ABC-type bacteriocin/lantibiotic exporter with double-glycine peptidase domain